MCGLSIIEALIGRIIGSKTDRPPCIAARRPVRTQTIINFYTIKLNSKTLFFNFLLLLLLLPFILLNSNSQSLSLGPQSLVWLILTKSFLTFFICFWCKYMAKKSIKQTKNTYNDIRKTNSWLKVWLIWLFYYGCIHAILSHKMLIIKCLTLYVVHDYRLISPFNFFEKNCISARFFLLAMLKWLKNGPNSTACLRR